MPRFIWSNFGSMIPVEPSTGGNQITLVENMLKSPDGSLYRRSGFKQISTIGPVDNHIVTRVNGVSTMIVKAGSTVYAKTQHSLPWTQLTLPAPPISNGRGSFCAWMDEVYYCDPQSIWRWDGASNPVRPGVPDFLTIGDYSTWSYLPDGDITEDPLWWLDNQDNLKHGGKVGTFAYTLSYYDPKRNIYGPRSPSQIAVIAATLRDFPVKLFGYEIDIPTPSDYATYASRGYEVAVWVSQSIAIELISTGTTCVNGQDGLDCDSDYVLQFQPGEYLSDKHFLEGHASSVGTTFVCRKDNATLVSGTPAEDTFEQPHESQLMGILPDGTALYFYPSIAPGGGTKRNVVEYSVGHPEQIGRRKLDFLSRIPQSGETISYAPLLRGTPIAFVDAGRYPAIMLTDQDAYGVTFGGNSLQLTPIGGGQGVFSTSSICDTPLGPTYISPDSHVLIGADDVVQIDKRLGYTSYLELLTSAQRKQMACGAVSDTFLLWMPDVDPIHRDVNTQAFCSALVYDTAQKFLSRFVLGNTTTSVKYCAGATLQDGEVLYAFLSSSTAHLQWPSELQWDGVSNDSGASFVAKAEMWLVDGEGEHANLNKTIRSIEVVYGECEGVTSSGSESGPIVSVEACENPYDVGSASESDSYRQQFVASDKVPANEAHHRRVIYNQFAGLSGRFIKITVGTDSQQNVWAKGNFRIKEVQVVYEVDNEPEHYGRT